MDREVNVEISLRKSPLQSEADLDQGWRAQSWCSGCHDDWSIGMPKTRAVLRLEQPDRPGDHSHTPVGSAGSTARHCRNSLI